MADDDDVVDIRAALAEECRENNGACSKLWSEYLACKSRIEAKGSGECSAQYFEYYAELDKCIVPKLWPTLR